jgi:hypothetical protein
MWLPRAESNALLLFGDRITLQKPMAGAARLEYPTPPFPSTLTIVIGTLTSGFRSLALESQLSIEVLGILARTIRWTRCIDPAPGLSPSATDQAFLANFDPRANSAELMRLCRVVGEENLVETAICKAIYVYHANLLGWTCRCSGYRRVVEELGEALHRWESRKTWDRELWQWLAMITANAARRGKMQKLQIEVMAWLFAAEDTARDWESMEETTKRFLSHSRLGREWKLCWAVASASAL